eukprot:CAMPEP_0119158908 /NCGR_PEP_ID=MMETSP1310-20130426/53498_1 /TAXON_ID=464262 /ORGANISM="Genus nov. species nov., Strain RCC2339" /LENGTH=385 /DNA_ID=CAMNT_0007151537 /DNA_START=95 /DNA_END=1248 /DNA_ORIENTATION=+
MNNILVCVRDRRPPFDVATLFDRVNRKGQDIQGILRTLVHMLKTDSARTSVMPRIQAHPYRFHLQSLTTMVWQFIVSIYLPTREAGRADLQDVAQLTRAAVNLYTECPVDEHHPTLRRLQCSVLIFSQHTFLCSMIALSANAQTRLATQNRGIMAGCTNLSQPHLSQPHINSTPRDAALIVARSLSDFTAVEGSIPWDGNDGMQSAYGSVPLKDQVASYSTTLNDFLFQEQVLGDAFPGTIRQYHRAIFEHVVGLQRTVEQIFQPSLPGAVNPCMALHGIAAALAGMAEYCDMISGNVVIGEAPQRTLELFFSELRRTFCLSRAILRLCACAITAEVSLCGKTQDFLPTAVAFALPPVNLLLSVVGSLHRRKLQKQQTTDTVESP